MRLRTTVLCALGLPGAILVGWLIARAAHAAARPAPAPLVLLFVPHFGATGLTTALRKGDLPYGGLRQLALREGAVVRSVNGADPATTTSFLGAVLSGREPRESGAVLARAPSPFRRHSASVWTMSRAFLGRVIFDEATSAPMLAAGLPQVLLPDSAELWATHEHGESQLLELSADDYEDAVTAGWVLSRAPKRATWKCLSLEVDVAGTDGTRGQAHCDLLFRTGSPEGLSAVCRDRDAVGGRHRRAGAAWRLESPIACLASPDYFETATALLEEATAGATATTLRVSAFSHPATRPPALAAELGTVPVRRLPDGGDRWRDAETIDAFTAALGLARHSHLAARLDGPVPGASARQLDLLLGSFARSVVERGGTLLVVGLPDGEPCTGSIDLAASLSEFLPSELAACTSVHAEEGFARIDVSASTAVRLALVVASVHELAGKSAKLEVDPKGVIEVQAAAGIALDGAQHATVTGGSTPGTASSASFYAVGPRAHRRLESHIDALELAARLVKRWAGQ